MTIDAFQTISKQQWGGKEHVGEWEWKHKLLKYFNLKTAYYFTYWTELLDFKELFPYSRFFF